MRNVLMMRIYYLKDNHSLIHIKLHIYILPHAHAHTYAHDVLAKMKPYAIVLLWLGVQAPSAEVHVVLEVPSEVDEGMS